MVHGPAKKEWCSGYKYGGCLFFGWLKVKPFEIYDACMHETMTPKEVCQKVRFCSRRRWRSVAPLSCTRLPLQVQIFICNISRSERWPPSQFMRAQVFWSSSPIIQHVWFCSTQNLNSTQSTSSRLTGFFSALVGWSQVLLYSYKGIDDDTTCLREYLELNHWSKLPNQSSTPPVCPIWGELIISLNNYL